MKRVLIMMSTFNGEKYINEQLDSILSQKDVNIHVLIRDDGSSDSTLSILETYKNNNPNVFDIIKGINIGWKRSFFTLLQKAHSDYADFEYFAFSDQDDIWLPEKLYRATEYISSIDCGPQLYCSNLIFYRNGKAERLIRNRAIKPTYKNCLIRNYATGCSIVFNRQLLEKLNIRIPDYSVAHDHWCYMVAVILGTVYVDPESFILYRQHDANQIGSRKGFIQQWKRRLKSISSLINGNGVCIIASELLKIYGVSLNMDAKNALLKLTSYKTNLSKRLSLLCDSGYTFNKKSSDFWLKLRIVFGRL